MTPLSSRSTLEKLAFDDAPLAVERALHREVDDVRLLGLGERAADLVVAGVIDGIDELAHLRRGEADLGEAGDLVRAPVREQDLAVDVEDEDAVGRRVEEVGVALEGLEPPLGLEARERDALGLVAHRLQDARVAERDRGRVGDGARARKLVLAEGHGLPAAEEQDAHGLVLEQDRQQRERAERGRGHVGAHDVEERMRRRVLDDERLARLHDLLDLGVLAELDGQVAELFVVARGHDVADVARVAHEHDAAPIDARDVGDAAHDREEDVSKVERRAERLRELEHDLRVALPCGRARRCTRGCGAARGCAR